MRTIILGLGNPSFADDGAGIATARALKSRLAGLEISVEEATVAGLDVLEMLEGFDRAVIIDAVQTPEGRPGAIYKLKDIQASYGAGPCAHQLDCLAALQLGNRLGLPLPQDITILAIEAATLEPSEHCSEEVLAAIPRCVEMVERELQSRAA